jgi:hypothetical protein
MKNIFILSLFFALLVCAAHAGFGQEVVRDAREDLNGDGVLDTVSIARNPGLGEFTLFVNEKPTAGRLTDSDVDGFVIVDVNKSDPYREIAVMTYGESDDYEYQLYRFDGVVTTKIGGFFGVPSFSGNGIVLVDEWMGFWALKEKYVLDNSSGKLRQVPQELYFVDVNATVRESFPVYKTRDGRSVVANTLPNSRILIIACDPSPRCPESGDYFCDWYLIKTVTGLVGWVRLESLSERVVSLPWAD